MPYVTTTARVDDELSAADRHLQEMFDWHFSEVLKMCHLCEERCGTDWGAEFRRQLADMIIHDAAGEPRPTPSRGPPVRAT